MPTIYNNDKTKLNEIFRWQGFNKKCTPQESINKYGFAIRLIDKRQKTYECFLPDPEFNDCCVHIKNFTYEDIFSIIESKRLYYEIMTRDGMTTSQLKNELTLDELILKLCDLFDIIDFFDLNGNDSDAIERQTVIEMITESLKHNSVLLALRIYPPSLLRSEVRPMLAENRPNWKTGTFTGPV